MKMQFKMIIEGNDSMEEKFLKTLQENPDAQMDLIRANIHLIMLAFRWGKDENICLESYNAGKIPQEEIPITVSDSGKSKVAQNVAEKSDELKHVET
jgi:hypothetical protein